MKVSELNGAELDAWVARALGWADCPYDDDLWKVSELQNEFKSAWKPSADWEQGGPIIERESIAMVPWKMVDGGVVWTAYSSRSGADLEMLGGYFEVDGGVNNVSHTPLIAAMRAYVASKFGETLPDD